MGGAARYAAELEGYLARTGRAGRAGHRRGAARRAQRGWCAGRSRSRRRAAGSPSTTSASSAPGGPRWALLRNALHFLTDAEADGLDRALRASVRREAVVVRLAARRADVLVVPCTAMAERVTRALPAARSRIVVRAHPVSAGAVPAARPRCGHPVPGAVRALQADGRAARRAARRRRGRRGRGGPGAGHRQPADFRPRLASQPAARIPGPGRPARACASLGPQPRHLLPHRPGVVRLPARGGTGQRAAGDRPGHRAEQGDRRARTVRLSSW